MTIAETEFITFDGAIREMGEHQRPERLVEFDQIPIHQAAIARGGGYSYTPASFGAGARVVDMSRFNRILAFDPTAATARVEAGARIGDVLTFLLEHGWSLPVVPGYPAISIGGCIAANVHGKNPLRDGCFSRWVERLTLYTPAHGFETVSRSEDADLFAMTCGGYGLTGIIVDATLRLVRQPSAAVLTTTEPVASFEHAVVKLKSSPAADFAYTHHDPLARAGRTGCGAITIGRITEGHAPRAPRYRLLNADSRAKSVRLWNTATLKLASSALRQVQAWRSPRRQHLFAATFPLAFTPSYFSWFGLGGFIESQYLVSWASAADFAANALALARRCGATPSLVSMKSFDAQAKALALSGAGILLTIDTVRDTAGVAFARSLCDLALECGAQPYLTKNGACSPALASATLPHFGEFAEGLAQRRRAGHMFRSRLSQSLGL